MADPTASPAETAHQFVRGLMRKAIELDREDRALDHLRWLATTAPGIDPAARKVYSDFVWLEEMTRQHGHGGS